MSCVKFNRKIRRRGFTLLEVLVAVAIAGLVVAGGFRLISMSLRSLAEIRRERELTAAAQKIWWRFRTETDMPSSGQEDDIEHGTRIEWRTEIDSVPVEELELTFRRVIISLYEIYDSFTASKPRSMVIYLPYNK